MTAAGVCLTMLSAMAMGQARFIYGIHLPRQLRQAIAFVALLGLILILLGAKLV